MPTDCAFSLCGYLVGVLELLSIPFLYPTQARCLGRRPGNTSSEPIPEEENLPEQSSSVCRRLFRILPRGSCLVLGFVGRKVPVSDPQAPLMLSAVKVDVHLFIILIIFYAPSSCKPVWKIKDFFKHHLIKRVPTPVPGMLRASV